MNKPTGITGSYEGKQYEQINDRGRIKWRPEGGGLFVTDDKILLALNKNSKKSQPSKQSNSKITWSDWEKTPEGTQKVVRSALKIADPLIGKAISKKYGQYDQGAKKRTVKVKKKTTTPKQSYRKTVTPKKVETPQVKTQQVETAPTTAVEQPQVVVQPAVQPAVQQPQSTEQFVGAPLRVLDEDMLNDSSVKDYGTLLDYMYNNPNSSFTQGFMNMIYSNMGSNLDYWDPNVESQWEYLRRNQKPIERIAGIRGRYGNGLFGTSGDYQDLIRSINGYAREGNRGIMYNRPQQGYTPYNVYPGQLAPTGLVVQQPIQTSNNMITINGENLELGQGWGVRDGQVYDETGRLRTWSPQELRFLKRGGILKYLNGGDTLPRFTRRRIGRLSDSDKAAFLFDNDILNLKGVIYDLLNKINKALESLGYVNQKITVDGKLGKLTQGAYNFLKDFWNNRNNYRYGDNFDGSAFDGLFNDVALIHDSGPAQPTNTSATPSPTSSPTQLMTPNRLRTIQRDFFRSNNINDYNSFVDYMESNTGSDLSKAFMNMAQINGWTKDMQAQGNVFNWLRNKENQKTVEKALGTRGKWGRGLFGFSGDLEDATNILNDYINGINRENNLRQLEINTNQSASDRMWGNIPNANPQPTQQSNLTAQPNNPTKLAQQSNSFIYEDLLKKSRLGMGTV